MSLKRLRLQQLFYTHSKSLLAISTNRQQPTSTQDGRNQKHFHRIAGNRKHLDGIVGNQKHRGGNKNTPLARTEDTCGNTKHSREQKTPFRERKHHGNKTHQMGTQNTIPESCSTQVASPWNWSLLSGSLGLPFGTALLCNNQTSKSHSCTKSVFMFQKSV